MQFFGGSDVSPFLLVTTAERHNPNMFKRNGVCLFYREWNRPLHTLNPQQDHKLMFGLLFSLQSITAKMDPTSGNKGNLGMPQLLGQGCSFHSFRTDTYKLSFMESPSDIKIILVTHCKTADLREATKYNYNLYVEYVAKSPLYTPGTPISHARQKHNALPISTNPMRLPGPDDLVFVGRWDQFDAKDSSIINQGM